MKNIHPTAYSKIQHLPNHHRVLKSSLEFLAKLKEIDGVFLKGGLANGIVGPFTSLDIGIFCQNLDERNDIFQSHKDWKISPGLRFLKSSSKRMFKSQFVSDPNLNIEFHFHVIEDLPDIEEGPFIIAWDESGHLTHQFQNQNEIQKKKIDWSDVGHEDEKFWVWTHFSASQAAKGEFHDVLNYLEDLREIVQVWQERLDLMARQNAKRTGNRFRHEFIDRLTKTFCPPHGEGIKIAFQNLIKIQLQQRALIARTVSPEWKVSPGLIAKIQNDSISWK